MLFPNNFLLELYVFEQKNIVIHHTSDCLNGATDQTVNLWENKTSTGQRKTKECWNVLWSRLLEIVKRPLYNCPYHCNPKPQKTPLPELSLHYVSAPVNPSFLSFLISSFIKLGCTCLAHGKCALKPIYCKLLEHKRHRVPERLADCAHHIVWSKHLILMCFGGNLVQYILSIPNQ